MELPARSKAQRSPPRGRRLRTLCHLPSGPCGRNYLAKSAGGDIFSWEKQPDMETKKQIVENGLPRYPGVPLKDFGRYILLTNFQYYVKLSAQWPRVPVMGKDKPMPSATAGGITI